MKCADCGAENAEGSKFCGQCGARLEQKCPNCGETVPPSNKFCPSCGTRLTAPSTAAEPAAAPPSVAPAQTTRPVQPVAPAAPPPAAQSYSQPTYGPPAPPSYGPPPPPAAPAYGPPPAPAYAPPAYDVCSGPAPAAGYGFSATSTAADSGYVAGPTAGLAAPWPGAQSAWVYKGLAPRFFALLIDGIIVGLPSYALVGVLFGDQMGRALAYGDTAAFAGPYMLMMVISLAYTLVLEAGGGTLGKRILGMKIVDAQGNKPGFGKSLVRNLLRIVDALPFAYLIGIIAVASSQTKQRVGDKAAGTFVVAK